MRYVIGLENIEKRLELIKKAAKEKTAPVILESANKIADDARSLVPNDTGNLKDSIRVEHGDTPLQYFVKAGGEATTRQIRNGTDATYDYAAAVEYGTTKNDAQPFFWPAYRLNKKKVRARIRRKISTEIRKAWKNVTD
ncbi:HK97-gp10 family putative phage morphogenesis protein [Bartonella tamiae]|uniref:HK97 gp10 family phage protein n=1 Tax=Bartonella tamiae Th239 TaxID=1094558 RepID=J1K3H8_9HYPH|nr:HK97-gp10 family putative phage morphogenesis protein [Bartonella tamiae]EJF91685.1 HK97 gp10 family phage protein [Bartonella tamiae Th239]